MRLPALLAIMTLLAGCGQSNLPQQDDDYGRTGEIVAPRPQTSTTPSRSNDTADSVPIELRDVAPEQKPVPAPDPVPPRFVDLSAKDGTRSGVSMSVIRDRQTGCEYVITKLYGEDLSAEPRVESTTSDLRTQRCVTPTKGSGYVWIGDSLPVTISTVQDTQTGCEYILGTMYGQASFLLPRMIRTSGTTTAPLCRRRN